MSTESSIPPVTEALIKDLAREDRVAAELLKALSARERNAKFTTIDNVMRIARCSRTAAWATLKKFKALDCGRLKKARDPSPGRIIWAFDARSIGQLVRTQ